METPVRSLIKAVTWQLLGLLTMTALGYLVFGELAGAGLMSLLSAASGFIFYLLHEQVWARVRWGLRLPA
ncbi:MAG: DUF2061 domain-containing protein [Geminicoccaceae bacterium]